MTFSMSDLTLPSVLFRVPSVPGTWLAGTRAGRGSRPCPPAPPPPSRTTSPGTSPSAGPGGEDVSRQRCQESVRALSRVRRLDLINPKIQLQQLCNTAFHPPKSFEVKLRVVMESLNPKFAEGHSKMGKLDRILSYFQRELRVQRRVNFLILWEYDIIGM